MDFIQRPIVGKNYRIVKHKKGPRPGTVDLQVELIPRTPPTPEKFQRKARIRRLKQAWKRGELTDTGLWYACQRVRDEYELGQ